MTYKDIQSALLCDRGTDELPESAKNCAAGGVQLFQVFSSTSALLGLSRSSDYSAVNANLNCLINWRRESSLTGQSNMWGEIRGTGLAGGGTGASGGGHGGKETMAVRPMEPAQRGTKGVEEEAGDDEFPPEFYQRGPATDDFVVAHREASNPIELTHRPNFTTLEAEGFMPVRGLQVNVKTRTEHDKVLLICNLPTSMAENHDGTTWTLKRGNYLIGPKFASWTHELGRLETVLMPWLDEPGKARLDLDYTVSGRLKGGIKVSREQERRQLTAILVPGGQVTSARSHEPVSVQTGRWYDVPGLQQISVTGEGEKVLVICSIKYTALWSDDSTRGRFTIFRDGAPLDVESYGLQSVRALQRGLKRTLVMALVDDPAPGPHLYAARAAVTAEEEPRVCHLDDDDRQLALIRLPGSIVFGPARCVGPTMVEEDRWTQIEGLSVQVTVDGASDKVLLVYGVNFNPTGLNYEAYFTVFRTSAQGATKNLGRQDQGMWSVASSAAASSEYPVGMFTDAPGPGCHTYAVYARTVRCDHLTEAPTVEVGPDGQLAAIPLRGPGRTRPTAS